MVTETGRPAPLRDIAKKWATVYAAGTAIVSGLVTAGVISAGQAGTVNDDFSAIDLLLSALVGIISAGAATMSAFSTAKTGENVVTPVASPRDDANRPLVPTLPTNNPATDLAGGI